MAKRQSAKTNGGGRNPDRPNGKAWGRHSPKYVTIGHPGHNKTGRTKPSGCTVGGHSKHKLSSKTPSQVKASRD